MPRITLGFDEFGWEALAATAERHGLGPGEFISASCRRYLAGARNGVPPAFARSRFHGVTRAATVDLLAAELGALEDAAARMKLPLEALIRHAVITLVADIDSGRVSAELATTAPGHAGATGA